MCVCECVRVCVRACWGQGCGLGGMELWVCSNDSFLCILLLLIWHMHFIFFGYIYSVSCMYYFCEHVTFDFFSHLT